LFALALRVGQYLLSLCLTLFWMHLIERKQVKYIGGAKTTQAEGKMLSVKRGKNINTHPEMQMQMEYLQSYFPNLDISRNKLAYVPRW